MYGPKGLVQGFQHCCRGAVVQQEVCSRRCGASSCNIQNIGYCCSVVYQETSRNTGVGHGPPLPLAAALHHGLSIMRGKLRQSRTRTLHAALLTLL